MVGLVEDLIARIEMHVAKRDTDEEKEQTYRDEINISSSVQLRQRTRKVADDVPYHHDLD